MAIHSRRVINNPTQLIVSGTIGAAGAGATVLVSAAAAESTMSPAESRMNSRRKTLMLCGSKATTYTRSYLVLAVVVYRSLTVSAGAFDISARLKSSEPTLSTAGSFTVVQRVSAFLL
jgi:hypothetical protein